MAHKDPAIPVQEDSGSSETAGADPTPPTAPTVATFEQVHATLRSKLFSLRVLALDATARSRFWGWMGPALIAIFAGALRFVRLGFPQSLVFDETYYVKGAYTLLRNGFENDWPKEPNDAWNAGQLDTYLPAADYVVHPPLGKWMIAFGMWLGDPSNAFFWRLSTALVSVIAVFLIARAGRALFGSTSFGLVAAGLFAIDGVAIVHARTGLLDSFLMFFVVVAFALLVKDRQWRRSRLAHLCAQRLYAGFELGRYGPRLGWGWYRFFAALSLGLATGVKWSGAYYVAVFCVMAVLWDAGARRAVGVERWLAGAFLRDAVPSALIMVPTAIAGYGWAWASWFINPNSYGRQWHVDNPANWWSWLPDFVTAPLEALRSLTHYHQTMLTFHTGLTSEHTYEAGAWGWLLQLRPTSFFWEKSAQGENGCTATECASAITSIGNPLIWWVATLAFVVALFLLFRNADWRAGAIVAGIGAGWIPWLAFPDRTIFTFYTIAFAPFMYLAIAYLAQLMWERWSQNTVTRRRLTHFYVWAGAIIVAVSAFFYPIWTGIQVPMWFWQIHMWLPSWV